MTRIQITPKLFRDEHCPEGNTFSVFEAFGHLNFEFVSDLDIRISNLSTSLKRLAGRAYEIRTGIAGGLT
jgi:hypothetical protein